MYGWTCRFTPPAMARSVSPLRRSAMARWMAESADEHMVSTARLGPLRPSEYETRLAIEAYEDAAIRPFSAS
ncbi:hypothetical protein GCM10027199_37420 [Amycolatopsis magusensis]